MAARRTHVTVVTAFYALDARRSVETYLTWARVLFEQCAAPIVLYTSADLVPTFLQMRGSLPIHFVTVPLEACEMWRAHTSKWNECKQRMDYINQRLKVSALLCALWANKAVWMEQAAQKNVFNTQYFLWADAGIFREVPHALTPVFPLPDFFPPNKMLFFTVAQCTKQLFLAVRSNNYHYLHRIRRHPKLVGGLWGGDKNACLQWAAAFRRETASHLHSDQHDGNDQITMLATLLRTPALGVVAKPYKFETTDNLWWFGLSLLSGERVFEQDVTFASFRQAQLLKEEQ